MESKELKKFKKEHIELNKFLSIIEKTAPVLEENDDYEKCKYLAGDEDEYFLELKLYNYKFIDCGDCDDAVDYLEYYLKNQGEPYDIFDREFDEEQFLEEIRHYSDCKPTDHMYFDSDVPIFRIRIEDGYVKTKDADEMLKIMKGQDEEKEYFLNKQKYLSKLVRLVEEKQEQEQENKNNNKYKI